MIGWRWLILIAAVVLGATLTWLASPAPSAAAPGPEGYGTVTFTATTSEQVDHEYLVWQANHPDLVVTAATTIPGDGPSVGMEGVIIFYRRAE